MEKQTGEDETVKTLQQAGLDWWSVGPFNSWLAYIACLERHLDSKKLSNKVGCAVKNVIKNHNRIYE